ncbi:DUF2075 domain-containing protein [Bifidobacterium vespertilionis]|uniref:DUF2075 domain-containing protein n=1 Tax=Bifidobacterium vespertilionis TaxID=2562524 RepID=UPI001F0AAA0E|nr:DUF2075 domain-containing protein [Bifidobacterium vespertilionis]
MSTADDDPVILNLPYGKHEFRDFATAYMILNRGEADSESDAGHGMTYLEWELLSFSQKSDLKYVIDYPTVYVVYSDGSRRRTGEVEYTAYVGETNDIMRRTGEHLESDPSSREDWKAIADAIAKDASSFHQYVIGHPLFNKSLTLDVENRLMHYMSSVEAVAKLGNRRTNAQGDYYTSDKLDRVFSEIWLGLHKQDPTLFPAEEIIRDSALFKASPFHRLSPGQVAAEDAILKQLEPLVADTGGNETDVPKLIFVQGVAGTGKTVLLSHLFYRIATEMVDRDDKAALKSYLLVNHKEQVHVYNQIAIKLGLQKNDDEIVMLPTQFINRFSGKQGETNKADLENVIGTADVVLIDEAHLLMTQGNQGYSGKNHLYDILRRARVVVAVFDPNQILQAGQQWHPETLAKLFPNDQLTRHDRKTAGMIDGFSTVEIGAAQGLRPLAVDVAHIHLERQFRIAASDAVMKWVDDFAAGRGLSKLPKDDGDRDRDGNLIRAPYQIKVFDSPVDLYRAIRKKAEERADGCNGVGLSRILATYDWRYVEKTKNDADPNGCWTVSLHRDADGTWVMGSADGDHRGYVPESESGAEGREDRFCMPWNYQLPKAAFGRGSKSIKDLAWAEKPYTINEVGSTFTIQGFDLNFAGVIIGPSVKYRDGRIVFDKSASHSRQATNKRRDLGDFSESNLRNQLNVLLKRGVHGLYLFAVDPELQRKLKECCG